MNRLLLVELTRLRWRRAIVLLTVGAVVVPGIILAAVLWNTRPVSAEEIREAERQVAEESAQPYIQRELARCERNPGRYGIPEDADVRAGCEEIVLPQVEWYTTRSELDLRSEREQGSAIAVAVVLTALMLLAGTTFAGHDWNSGSMSNQLLFEPRRTRVWAAKALVLLIVGGSVTLAVLVAYWTGLVLTAQARDVPIPDQAIPAAYKQAVLAAGFAGLAGVGGYALTMLFRSTVATLGVLFAFAVAGSILIAAIGFGGNQRIQPPANFAAYLVGSYTYVDYDRPECYDGGDRTCSTRVTRADAGLYFGSLLALAVVPSVLSFRRRDVP